MTSPGHPAPIGEFNDDGVAIIPWSAYESA